VDDGLVTLTGTVDNLLARKAAEQDAKNTLGVWRVKNYLKVRPVTVPSDNEIKGMVQDALSTKPFAEGKDINVRVYYGKVYLDGAVDSLYEKSMVENVVFRVRGVVEVKNNLKAQFTFPEKEDWEIKEDIEYELWWSPFVNSDQVRVNVSDGVATLTGEVGSWRERNAATDNAYDGGAWKVRNLLKVEVGPKYYEPSW
jgi:osmotically-inducible protein OsmY